MAIAINTTARRLPGFLIFLLDFLFIIFYFKEKTQLVNPKKITLTFSDGTELIYELEDVNDAQMISFADGIAAESITITIDSVYEGTAYEDTVITEICFE